jgi:phosphomannomutase
LHRFEESAKVQTCQQYQTAYTIKSPKVLSRSDSDFVILWLLCKEAVSISLAMIKFGTSGWRAIIADEFTFVTVRRVTQAIANWLKVNGKSNKIIIGYDMRLMAEVFSAVCANQLAANGFEPFFCDRPTPASHNSPQYCGMKLSTADGAPALGF